MPVIDISLSEGLYSSQQKSSLAQQLTQCLLKCDVTRDNPKAPAINWCYIHELPDAHIFVAGVAQKKPHYRIDISIMQGAMSEAVKQQVVADMTEVMLAMEGQKVNPLNASRVWILFHEITEGNWAAAGHIYRLADLMKYLKG
jgi:phenylpyruvate tautomerase PptA (4-oxalocrotonate tautomerase family)